MKKEYVIQLSQTATVSKTIKAESFDEATEIAKGFAYESDGESHLVKPAKGWGTEWVEGAEIVAIIG